MLTPNDPSPKPTTSPPRPTWPQRQRLHNLADLRESRCHTLIPHRGVHYPPAHPARLAINFYASKTLSQPHRTQTLPALLTSSTLWIPLRAKRLAPPGNRLSRF